MSCGMTGAKNTPFRLALYVVNRIWSVMAGLSMMMWWAAVSNAYNTGLLPLPFIHCSALSRREATPARICSMVPLTAPSLIADIRSILIGHITFWCCSEMARSRTCLLSRGLFLVNVESLEPALSLFNNKLCSLRISNIASRFSIPSPRRSFIVISS